MVTVFSIFIICFLNSCTATMSIQRKAYDNDKYVVKQSDSYAYAERIGRTVNSTTDIQFSAFSGTDTIVFIMAEAGDELIAAFNSDISEGEFRIALISPDNDVSQILFQSEQGQKSFILEEGVSRIKFVGRDSSGTVHLRLAGQIQLDYGR